MDVRMIPKLEQRDFREHAYLAQVRLRPAAAEEHRRRRLGLQQDAGDPIVIEASLQGRASIEGERNTLARDFRSRDHGRRNWLQGGERTQERRRSPIRLQWRLGCRRQVREKVLGPRGRVRQLHPGHAGLFADRSRLRQAEGEIGQDPIHRILNRRRRLRRRKQRPDSRLAQLDGDPQRQTSWPLKAPPKQQPQSLVDVGASMLEVKVGPQPSECDRSLRRCLLRGRIVRRPASVKQRGHERALLGGDEQIDWQLCGTDLCNRGNVDRLSINAQSPEWWASSDRDQQGKDHERSMSRRNSAVKSARARDLSQRCVDTGTPQACVLAPFALGWTTVGVSRTPASGALATALDAQRAPGRGPAKGALRSAASAGDAGLAVGSRDAASMATLITNPVTLVTPIVRCPALSLSHDQQPSGQTRKEETMNAQIIEGAVALVTGAKRGIGRALTEALLTRGVRKVYATARNPEALRALRD